MNNCVFYKCKCFLWTIWTHHFNSLINQKKTLSIRHVLYFSFKILLSDKKKTAIFAKICSLINRIPTWKWILFFFHLKFLQNTIKKDTYAPFRLRIRQWLAHNFFSIWSAFFFFFFWCQIYSIFLGNSQKVYLDFPWSICDVDTCLTTYIWK